MEDDDEFGDLYSDVIPTFTTSVQSRLADTDASKSSQNHPIDSDDEEILFGASQLKNSSSGLAVELDAPTLTGKESQPERGRFDSNFDVLGIVGGNISSVGARGLEKGEGSKLPEKGAGELNFMEGDDDLNIVVEESEQRDDEFVEKDVKLFDKQADMYSSAERNENLIDYVEAAEQMIPVPSGETGNQGGPTFEDEWDSDESEDDLQIVLNDNLEQMGTENMAAADDEDGEALVIVADDGDLSHGFQQTEMEDRERGGEEGADAERKELGNVAKTSGGGGTSAPTAVQPKIGYSNHMYHQPYHSQFKVNHLCPMRTSILIGF